MSSSGMMREMTPLLPWRPAILSPGCSLRLIATKTLTIFITPGGSSSPRCSLSTLLSNRSCRRFIDSSNCLFTASISACVLSALTAIWRHWPGVNSPSTVVDDLRARLQALEAAGDHLVHQHFLELAVEAALEDGLFVVAVLGETLDLVALDRQRALVLVDAAAVEHADLDDGARRRPAAPSARCRARRPPSRRRSRAAASLPASSGSRPSASPCRPGCRRPSPRRRYRRCRPRRGS